MSSRGAAKGPIQLLLIVVVITRLGSIYLADHPDNYGTPGTKVVGDVEVYEGWATAIFEEDRAPYSEVAIEYPPGVLPFAFAPKAGPEDSYRFLFILMMLLIDLAGLLGLYRIGQRRGSLLGAWLWAFGVPAIGPILYLRLDLIPAVATIWALERAAADSWTSSGAWLGFGIVTKVYPILILPMIALMARRKHLVVLGAAGAIALTLLPFIRSVDDLFTSVFQYHADRGLQVESSWAAALLLAGHFGYEVGIGYNFGAFHLASAAAPLLERIADIASLTALALGLLFAVRFARRDDSALAGEVSFATLALILALGTVFSPQFMVWLLALGAVVACDPKSPLLVPAMALIPLCALTQLIYPFQYDQLILRGGQELVAQLILVARNVGIFAVGAGAFVILARHRWGDETSDGDGNLGRASGSVG